MGTLTIPANYFVAGKTLRLRIYGVMTTAATTGTVSFTFALGSSTIFSTAGLTPTASLGVIFYQELIVTCVTTGSPGTCNATGALSYTLGNGAVAIDSFFSSAASGTALNTTIANAITLTSTNSVASGCIFKINNFMAEMIG